MVTSYIELLHGSGSKATNELVETIFYKYFDNTKLKQKNDQANLGNISGEILITTDSYVVDPIFFPGGNIGDLAVNGTINDIVVGGGKPLYLTLGLILEEGLLIKDLQKIISTMANILNDENVELVTGDTKVVQKGKGDKIFINTTGVGVKYKNANLALSNIKPGDKVIINGDIGDHGVAILSKRENLEFESDIISDTISLNSLINLVYQHVPQIHYMRDPTRGGIGSTLNEIAHEIKCKIRINEKFLPIKSEVQGACELLGLDPLYIANEGKVLFFCPEDKSDFLLQILRSHPLGKKSSIIGEVIDNPNVFVEMETITGGFRMIHWINGEQLPRIC